MFGLSSKRIVDLVKTTATEWSAHSAPRLGAALAYYTLLSVAPLLIFLVAIFGLVFDKPVAEHQLLGQVQAVAGNSAAKALQAVLDNAHQTRSGVLASAIALVTLLFGASGVFLELRDSLNTIWDASPARATTVRSFVLQRLVAFGTVLALGALLLGSLLTTATLTLVTRFFAGYLPVETALWGHIANIVLPLVGMSVLFALIFKFVPDVPVAWRDVAIGAVATAMLFEIGKVLLGLYLATAAVGSTYGAAGSLVAFVVWVYYSAQIFFFGAVFTRVYARSVGSQSGEAPTPVPKIPGQKPGIAPSSRSASA